MRRIPVASPAFSDKVAEFSMPGSNGRQGFCSDLSRVNSASSGRSRARSDSKSGTFSPVKRRVRSESSLHALPSDNSLPSSPSRIRTNSETNNSPRRRTALTGVGTGIHLTTEETSCAKILRNIYPSTLTGMDFLKAVNKPSHPIAQERCTLILPMSPESQVDGRSPQRRRTESGMSASMDGSNTHAKSSGIGVICGGRRGRAGSRCSIAAVQRAPVVYHAELQFIRRAAHWDSVVDSPIGDNALRLVQGAADTRHTFQEIRRKMLEGSSVISGRSVPFGFNAQVASLHLLRKKILDKYSSIQDAFIAINVENDGDLDKREWCGVLSTATQMCTLAEARAIYELMDADHDGSLTPTEFQLGIEIIGQVTTMELLRKRFICLGFQSMTQAIIIMNGPGPDKTYHPLSLLEFAEALKRVSIIEIEEHRAIFNAVRDPGDPLCRASLSDLACGLAVVSPCLLLEDLRSRIIKQFGSLEKALDYPRDTEDEEMDLEQFKLMACQQFSVCEDEAGRLFKSIDLDGGGNVSLDEIKRALKLVEVSMDLEDCRRKLRQGYRTIETAFAEAYELPEEEDLYFRIDEFVEVLEPLGLGKKNVTRLVELMGVSDHGVTIPEFFTSAQLFAPSCALEELKTQLLQTHRSFEAAFQQVKERREPLKREAWKSLLKEIGAQVEGADRIFDFLDFRSTGVTTVSETLAALQCLQSGSHRLLSQAESKAKAKDNVGRIFEPALRFASDLKAHVKGLKKDKAIVSQMASVENAMELFADGSSFITDPAPQLEAEIPQHLLERRTFMKIKNSMQVLPQKVRVRNVDELSAYFGSNENVLSDQKPLVDRTYHRAEEHHIVEGLKKGTLLSMEAGQHSQSDMLKGGF